MSVEDLIVGLVIIVSVLAIMCMLLSFKLLRTVDDNLRLTREAAKVFRGAARDLVKAIAMQGQIVDFLEEAAKLAAETQVEETQVEEPKTPTPPVRGSLPVQEPDDDVVDQQPGRPLFDPDQPVRSRREYGRRD